MENLKKEIYILKDKITKCRPLTQGEKENIQKLFSVEYTYNSNAIEGNTLTLAETEIVLSGNTVSQKPLKDHLEAVGHRDAFEYILSLVKEKNPINERIIKDIHSLVLADKPFDRGIYRKIPVKVLGSEDTPPEPWLIEEKIKELINEYNKSENDFFENAGLFHLKFESIHPFIDGNGRTGRLILNLMLMKNDFLPINIKFTDRVRYYDCFKTFFKNRDSAPMVNLIMNYEKQMLENYLNIIK